MSESNITSFLKKIIFSGVLISLLTPLIVNAKAFFPFNAPRALFFMGAVQIIFFVWLLLVIYNPNYRPKINIINILLFLFIVSLSLSTFFSVDSLTSFWSNHERSMGLVIHIHLFLFFLVITSTFKNEKDWIKIFGFSSVVALVVSLIGILDNFNIVSFAVDYSKGSTLGNTSFMGSYLLVNVFFAFYLFMRTVDKWKIFYAINLILISLGVILNPGGRAMKGSLLIGIIVFVALYFAFVYRHKIIRNFSRIIIIFGLIFSVIAGLMVFQENNLLREKVLGLHGMTGRLAVWEKAWDGFKERPVLGWGPETFEIVFLKKFNPQMFLESHGKEIWFDRAHNIIFDSLVANGLLGTILFFSIFLFALFVSWRKYLKEGTISFLVPLVFTSLFVAHFIQNLTVFDMISSYMLIFLSFAFINSISSENSEIKKEKRFNYLYLVILIPLFFSLSFFVGDPYQSNLFISKSLRSSEINELKIENSIESLRWSSMGIRQMRRHIAERFLADYDAEVKKLEKEIGQENSFDLKIEKEKKLLEKKELINETFKFVESEILKNIEDNSSNFKDFLTMGRICNDYFTFYYLDSLIKMYPDNGIEKNKENLLNESKEWTDKCQIYLKKAIELSPSNQQGYWFYAQAIINQGKIKFLLNDMIGSREKFEEAFIEAQKAVELEPKVLSYQISRLRIAKDLLKDSDLKEELIKEAIEVDSSWEEILNEYRD